MKDARILVGTLYCGENEYDACCSSIKSQTHKLWEHFTISDKPNKEAHDSLYEQFMERASDFELFIKVDADMVLARPTFFEEAAQWMQAHNDIDNLQVAVQDFFSNRLIGGLHVFRSTVRWERDDENVFVDHCPVAPDRRHTDFRSLAPAAKHCPHPSAFHSFHFGMHKGVKLIEAKNRGSNEVRQFASHLANIEYTYRHYRQSNLQTLGLACIGAELGIQGVLSVANVDYENADTKQQLERYLHLDDRRLLDQVKGLRRASSSVLGNRSWLMTKSRIERSAVSFLVAAKRRSLAIFRG